MDIESKPKVFTHSTVNHEDRERGHRARFIIESLDSEAKFTLVQVLTTSSLPIGDKHFARNTELNKWPHLDGVSLPKLDEREVSISVFDFSNGVFDYSNGGFSFSYRVFDFSNGVFDFANGRSCLFFLDLSIYSLQLSSVIWISFNLH